MKKMGTNYYLRYDFCTCCSRYSETHIGKSSGGWKFLFHVYPEFNSRHHPETVGRWLQTLYGYKNWSEWEGVFDEYGEKKTYDDFLLLVERKQESLSHQSVWSEVKVDEHGYESVNSSFS